MSFSVWYDRVQGTWVGQHDVIVGIAGHGDMLQ